MGRFPFEILRFVPNLSMTKKRSISKDSISCRIELPICHIELL